MVMYIISITANLANKLNLLKKILSKIGWTINIVRLVKTAQYIENLKHTKPYKLKGILL